MANTTDNKLKRKGMGAKASRRLSNFVIYVILILITVIWLFPFFGIVMESFKIDTQAMDGELFPKQWGFDNYIRLFKETDFIKWFINTAIMGVATAVFQTFFVLAMSYTLSRLRFKGRKALMNLMLILGMFPGFLTMILIYKVIMPLSGSIIIYTILMGFMAPWGDFMMASYIIHENSAGMSVAVGMYEWLSKTMLNSHYTMFCAAGVVVAIPVVAVFLALQKYYVEGVTGGAVKG